jgi:hypothetical protein
VILETESGCDVVYWNCSLQTFRRNILPPCSLLKIWDNQTQESSNLHNYHRGKLKFQQISTCIFCYCPNTSIQMSVSFYKLREFLSLLLYTDAGNSSCVSSWVLFWHIDAGTRRCVRYRVPPWYTDSGNRICVSYWVLVWYTKAVTRRCVSSWVLFWYIEPALGGALGTEFHIDILTLEIEAAWATEF